MWAVTQNFIIYTSNDGGFHWKRIKPNGFMGDLSITQLYAVNATTAFLGVSTNLTGVGPGIIYKTTDGGHNWVKVFSHKGNCDIIIGMFDERKGLMSCSFDSFDGSIHAGQALYYTVNGGGNWKKDTINPADFFVLTFETKNTKQAGMADYNNFYSSVNRGISWHTSEPFPDASEPKRYLQFEDSSYAVISSGNITDILVKRPGSSAWIDLHAPPGVVVGAVTGIILDGNECWMSEAFDTNELYYSADSVKTFTATIPVPNSSFQFLTKARHGRTLLGGTPSFAQGKLYINVLCY